jgi:glutaconate CoA-transferase, subunit A
VPVSKLTSLADAAGLIAPGCRIGFGGSNALHRRPLAFVRELVRQGTGDLRVHNLIGGLETDLLLGAGLVAETHCCFLGLDEFGQSAHFQRAVKERTVEVNEYTEFIFMAGLRAANMGLSFLPWRTGWGTDVAEQLGLKTVTCPYEGTEMLAVPAMRLDVAVLQVTRADEHGNVELPHPLDHIYDYDHVLARAAAMVIVCAEEIGSARDPSRTALIGREVHHVVHAPHGAWPGGLASHYEVDAEHLRDTYIPACASRETFVAYLEAL